MKRLQRLRRVVELEFHGRSLRRPRLGLGHRRTHQLNHGGSDSDRCVTERTRSLTRSINSLLSSPTRTDNLEKLISLFAIYKNKERGPAKKVRNARLSHVHTCDLPRVRLRSARERDGDDNTTVPSTLRYDETTASIHEGSLGMERTSANLALSVRWEVTWFARGEGVWIRWVGPTQVHEGSSNVFIFIYENEN